MKNNLITTFDNMVNRPGGKGTPFAGPNDAVRWVKKLCTEDREIIFCHLRDELSKSGDTSDKDLLIRMIGAIDGDDSISLLDKLIGEGEDIHGKLVAIARVAKKKILARKE